MNRAGKSILRDSAGQLVLAGFIAAIIGLLALPARGATKVAILARDKAGQQVAALAEAMLAGNGQVAIVDRTSVNRVIEEQKLSLINIDPPTSIKIGQLLNADLFAVVDPGAKGSSPLGVVVFDAGTGLRLEDLALPAAEENAPQAVADAIIAGCQKIHPDSGTLLPVCVLAVRNADLPLSMDPICDAIGLLLERRLVNFPGIGLLERRRLENVNAERNLPTTRTADPLWSSIVTIDLQLSRKDPGGIKALAVLSNSKGVEIGKIESSIDSHDPAALANTLAEALARQLKITSKAAMGDSVSEARRFLAEANFLGQLGDYPGAVQDAEAAMALHQTPDVQIALIQSLVRRAVQLLNFNVNASYWGNIPVSVPVDQVRQSQAMFEDAIDLFATLDPPVLGHTKQQHRFASMRADDFYPLARLYLTDSRNLHRYSDDVQQTNVELRKKFLSTAVARINAWKELGPCDEAVRNCQSEINSLTGDMNESLAANAQSPLEYIDDLSAVFKPWLDLVAQFQKTGQFSAEIDATCIGAMRHENTNGVSPIYSSFMTDPATETRRKAFYKTLCDHPYPPIRLYGYAATDTPDAFLDRVCRMIENPGVEPADAVRDQCYRVALDCYGNYFIWQKNNWPVAGLSRDAATDHCIALAKFMLDRKEIDESVLIDVIQVLEKAGERETAAPAMAMAMVTRAKAVLADPQCRDLDGHASYIATVLDQMAQRFATHGNEAAKPAPNPFKSVLPLMTPELANSSNIFGVTVDGDDVYAATMIYAENEKSIMQAWRVATSGHGLKKLGEIELPRPNAISEEESESMTGAPVCVRGDSNLFVRVGPRGLVQIPLDGTKPSRLDIIAQLPTPDVHAMAWLNGRLYVGMGDGGYVGRIDPKAGKCEIFASSRSKENRSSLDNCDAYNIAWMAPDAPRHRVIMWVENFTSRKPAHGFWQMDEQGKIKPYKSFNMLGQFEWADQPRNDKFCANIGNDGVSIDLATSNVDAFYAWSPGINSGGLDDRHAKFIGHDFFPPPYMLLGDSLWSGHDWAKIAPGHSPMLTFPSPRTGTRDPDFMPHVCMQSMDGGKAVIVANYAGIWLINLN